VMHNSDLTDSQWELIKPLISINGNCKIDRRNMVNAVFYLTKTGIQWRQLPKEYPHWKAVYSFFTKCKKTRIWEQIMKTLVQISRDNVDPTCGIIDSQSVKTNSKAREVGFDGGKKN
jgi:putative transposase